MGGGGVGGWIRRIYIKYIYINITGWGRGRGWEGGGGVRVRWRAHSDIFVRQEDSTLQSWSLNSPKFCCGSISGTNPPSLSLHFRSCQRARGQEALGLMIDLLRGKQVGGRGTYPHALPPLPEHGWHRPQLLVHDELAPARGLGPSEAVQVDDDRIDARCLDRALVEQILRRPNGHHPVAPVQPLGAELRPPHRDGVEVLHRFLCAHGEAHGQKRSKPTGQWQRRLVGIKGWR